MSVSSHEEMLEKLFIALLQRLSPSLAHEVARRVMRHLPYLVHKGVFEDSVLESNVCGLQFKNPIGIAAGLDKNAECVNALKRAGFGFLELGTVTLEPQKGNPAPRLFRLSEDRAIINRLGFNNNGIVYFLKSLESAGVHLGVPPIGINLGKNATSTNAISDYVRLVAKVSPFADYITLNISSPNTANLRDMQKIEVLEELLIAVRASLEGDVRIFIKVAPDLTDEAGVDIISLAVRYKVSGIIISNTTIGCRENLKSRYKVEYGGLSGPPLFQLSTALLRDMYKHVHGELVLIGCGGVSDVETAYTKIKNGAALIQAYTAFTYHGFSLLDEIKKGLAERLRSDGFSSVSEAVGVDV